MDGSELTIGANTEVVVTTPSLHCDLQQALQEGSAHHPQKHGDQEHTV